MLNSKIKKYIKERYIRNGSFCSYCEYSYKKENLILDHITPTSKNGNDAPENLVLCCNSCNSSKSDLDLEEWLEMNIQKRAFYGKQFRLKDRIVKKIKRILSGGCNRKKCKCLKCKPNGETK